MFHWWRRTQQCWWHYASFIKYTFVPRKSITMICQQHWFNLCHWSLGNQGILLLPLNACQTYICEKRPPLNIPYTITLFLDINFRELEIRNICWMFTLKQRKKNETSYESEHVTLIEYGLDLLTRSHAYILAQVLFFSLFMIYRKKFHTSICISHALYIQQLFSGLPIMYMSNSLSISRQSIDGVQSMSMIKLLHVCVCIQ